MNTIGRIKGEQTRVAEENAASRREIDALKARISSAEEHRRRGDDAARGARPDQEPRHRHAEAARFAESLIDGEPKVVQVEVHGQKYPIRPSSIRATSRSWPSSSRRGWPWRPISPSATPSAWRS